MRAVNHWTTETILGMLNGSSISDLDVVTTQQSSMYQQHIIITLPVDRVSLRWRDWWVHPRRCCIVSWHTCCSCKEVDSMFLNEWVSQSQKHFEILSSLGNDEFVETPAHKKAFYIKPRRQGGLKEIYSQDARFQERRTWELLIKQLFNSEVGTCRNLDNGTYYLTVTQNEASDVVHSQ